MSDTVYFFEDEYLDDMTPVGAQRAMARLESKIGATLLRYIRAHGPGTVKIEDTTMPGASTDMPYVSLKVSFRRGNNMKQLTKYDIQEASPEQLRIWIAEELGWYWTRGLEANTNDPTVYRWLTLPGSMEIFPVADGTEPICRNPLLDVPDWTGDIAAAWKLIEQARYEDPDPILIDVAMYHIYRVRARCLFHEKVIVFSESAPEAISRAWLLMRAKRQEKLAGGNP